MNPPINLISAIKKKVKQDPGKKLTARVEFSEYGQAMSMRLKQGVVGWEEVEPAITSGNNFLLQAVLIAR